MSDKEYFRGSKNPLNIFKTLYYDYCFSSDNPDYFWPDGIWCFCGAQGTGKTLSAVLTVQKLVKEYPKAIVVSNMDIKLPEGTTVIPFTDYKQIEETKNGINGVIFFIDELHVLFNSLESKEIPITEIACFCQMRKDRRVIIGTSQRFGRIAKPIREQMKYAIQCKNFLKLFQWNQLVYAFDAEEVEGKLQGEKVGSFFWIHSPELYKSYETLNKINRINRKGDKSK